MKRKAILVIILCALCACEKDGKANGYYKAVKNRSNSIEYNENPIYYRINNDTLILFKIKDLKVDSTRFVWDGNWYQNFDDKFLSNNKITYDSQNYLDVQTVKLGNSKYKVLSENSLTIQYDTIKNPEIGGMEDEMFKLLFTNKDTLQKVDKRYITTALKKDMAKDSLLFHKPFVTEDVARAEIIPYLLQNYNDSFQKVNPESLEIYRMDDNKFRINFQVKRPYGTTGDYKLEMVFDRESYKLQMK